MRIMKTLIDVDFPDQTLKKETLLCVEDGCAPNGLIYILAGKFAYRSIHIDHLAEVDLQQLINEFEGVQKSEGRYLEGLAEAGRVIAGLKERIQQLEWELEARDKKIELPQEVASALDHRIKVDGADWPAIIFDSFNIHLDHRKSVITDYAADNFPDLIMALVYGYTAAPEPEKDEANDLLKDVTSLVWDWWNNPPGEGKPHHHVGRLAEKICDFIHEREPF